ncbi:permease family protein (macronuclear) [Tetrahymena thermophila SB210]|uniref:Permease family protein n=1 Tax=Tetrahymena thermophila (strain SB210) TaxID=312017 RepID=Q24F48_TETTS|nr:permease family protein [Tetrahymena thermophila SB210]EAS06427.2 permease family protein [Tetrahymena thermophila SB210]|eukprot:XP_001026672.2 permease family protein [Tetrahymena thermophila SB210]
MQNIVRSRSESESQKEDERFTVTPMLDSNKIGGVHNSNIDLVNKKLLDMNQEEALVLDQVKEEQEVVNTSNSIPSTSPSNSILIRDLKFLQKMAYYFKFFSEFILRDFKIKPLNNLISVSTIVLLIVFLGLINIMMSLSPMIYLMMSEQEVGESDILIVNPEISQSNMGNQSLDNFMINYKLVNDQYCSQYLKGCSSRYYLKGMQTINSQDIFSDVLLIDILKEEQIGLGRRINLTTLKENECYISRNLNSILKKEVKKSSKDKQKIVLDFNLGLILSSLPSFQNEDLNQAYFQKVQFITQSLVKKFQMDGVTYNTYQDILFHYIPSQNLDQEIRDSINSFNIEGFLGDKNSEPVNLNHSKQYALCQKLAMFIMDMKFSLNLEVKDVIENSVGKFEDKISNFVILDYTNQYDYILQQACSSFIKQLTERMAYHSVTYFAYLNIKYQYLYEKLYTLVKQNADPDFFNKHAITLYGIYKDKQNIYLEEKTIKSQIQKQSNKFSEVFGMNYPIKTFYPLSITQIKNLQQKQILDNSYNCGVILLIALSSVIIYSVSQSSIQQKVQEYGIVRIIGYSTQSLIIFSLLKAIIFYMIPALIIAELLNLVVSKFIKDYFYGLLQFSTDISQDYSNSYYATTVLLGIGLPLFCNLYPFKQFFDRQVLSQAINSHQRVIQQTKVIIQKLEKYGVSLYATINSVILIIVGILAYYFAPYAFVSKKVGLFLLIVNLTFLMVNIGISFLLNIVQRRLELGWIRVILNCFCRKDKNLQTSIENNFKNNDNRMQKLGMIIMMIFSFYISIGSSVNSQIMMVQNMVKLNIGSDYMLEVQKNEISLDEYILTQNIEQFKSLFPNTIKSYSFVSKGIKTIEGFQRATKLRNNIGVSIKFDFKAIGPQFYDSIYNELLIADSPLFEGQNPSNSLYFSNGTSIGRVVEDEMMKSKDHYQIISKIYNDNFKNLNSMIEHAQEQYILYYLSSKDKKALSVEQNCHMDFILGATRYKGKPAGFAKKIPGFKTFTENSVFSMFQDSEALISYEQFHHILRVSWEIEGYSEESINLMLNSFPKNSTFNIPKGQLFIRLHDKVELTQQQKNMLKSILTENKQESSVHSDSQNVSFYDTHSILVSLNYLVEFWSLLFNLVSVFIFILTYYLLTITFKQNVQENLHNIKIFKSIGLNHNQVQKIFIYEGISVMIINGIVGLGIGMLLSIMIQQQLIVFLEMPFDFQQIPYKVTSLLLFMCIALSVYTSKSEIDQVKNKQIAHIDK